MTIKAIATQSDRIFLGDLSDEVKELEGAKCPQDKRAWVTVRQATAGDFRRVSNSGGPRKTQYLEGVRTDIWNDDWAEAWAMQSYCCLTGAGNIEGPDGKPIFTFESHSDYHKVKMSFDTFLARHDTLAKVVTNAIRKAVWSLNPDWDLLAEDDDDDESTEGEAD